jgi:hypothetical protein
MRPYEIYFAKICWKDCEDERPWLIVDTRGARVFGCFPISSHNYRSDAAFEVLKSDPDFGATGLTKDCFIHHVSIQEIERSQFRATKKGELTGDMLARFLDESGLS